MLILIAVSICLFNVEIFKRLKYIFLVTIKMFIKFMKFKFEMFNFYEVSVIY